MLFARLGPRTSIQTLTAKLFKSWSRLQAEIVVLGIEVARSTVSNYMPKDRRPPGQSWWTFLSQPCRWDCVGRPVRRADDHVQAAVRNSSGSSPSAGRLCSSSAIMAANSPVMLASIRYTSYLRNYEPHGPGLRPSAKIGPTRHGKPGRPTITKDVRNLTRTRSVWRSTPNFLRIELSWVRKVET